MKIYSWKARRTGSGATGRVQAVDMRDATRQVIQYLATFGPNWKIEVTELKNQAAALRKWEEKKQKGSER